ncbi:MAG: sirohydrochlorin cobaltochelatase [Lachnospiraceae bacterium]|nr:sirohydrochlorin cobaltochelatase [Lachnospiraceae bacterium]
MTEDLYSIQNPFSCDQDKQTEIDKTSEKEILVVSFGTSYEESCREDIGGIEKALKEAYPHWQVQRVFSNQHIIDRIRIQTNTTIYNVDQAFREAVNKGVKYLVVHPTFLIGGIEYEKLKQKVKLYEEQFLSLQLIEPLLEENKQDKEKKTERKADVAKIMADQMMKEAGISTWEETIEKKIAFILLGHGSYHHAAVAYGDMEKIIQERGYENVFLGLLEGKEEYTPQALIDKISEKGYTRIIMRPLMVSAGKHAYVDMAGEKKNSWLSLFKDSQKFEEVQLQIKGMGRIKEIQQIYIHKIKDEIGVTVS